MLQSLLTSSRSSLTWQQKSSTSAEKENNSWAPMRGLRHPCSPKAAKLHPPSGPQSGSVLICQGQLPLQALGTVLWGIPLALHTNTAFSKVSSPLLCTFLHTAEPVSCPAPTEGSSQHLQQECPTLPNQKSAQTKAQAGQGQLTELLRSWWKLLEVTASCSSPLPAAARHPDIPWNAPTSPPMIPEGVPRRSRRSQSRGQKLLCKLMRLVADC